MLHDSLSLYINLDFSHFATSSSSPSSNIVFMCLSLFQSSFVSVSVPYFYRHSNSITDKMLTKDNAFTLVKIFILFR